MNNKKFKIIKNYFSRSYWKWKTKINRFTCDKLKEGNNINKSVLVLIIVINTWVDKGMDKKKDVLPSYRDSTLKRILQNELGGKSKIVMICVLSPGSINYEKTLYLL